MAPRSSLTACPTVDLTFSHKEDKTIVRSAHGGGGRRVADSGDPERAGHLLPQGHPHPSSSPRVNVMPPRPLRGGARPPLRPASDSEPTEGKVMKSRLAFRTQRQATPLGTGLGIIYSLSTSPGALRYHLPHASGRRPLQRGGPRLPGTAAAKRTHYRPMPSNHSD